MLLSTTINFNGTILKGYIDSENLKDNERQYFYFYNEKGNIQYPNVIRRDMIR